jgi:hypothetical protein
VRKETDLLVDNTNPPILKVKLPSHVDGVDDQWVVFVELLRWFSPLSSKQPIDILESVVQLIEARSLKLHG